MVMVRASGLSCMMMRMPLTMTTPNVRMTAPPNTGVGMTEQSALTLGHSPATTMMPPATATTWRLNTRVIPSRPTSALARNGGAVVEQGGKRARDRLREDDAARLLLGGHALFGEHRGGRRVAQKLGHAADGQKRDGDAGVQGELYPQCSGSGNANHAACSTGPKSTRPSAAASAKPTASPMSGAAPCRKPRPNTLNARTVSKVTPASR